MRGGSRAPSLECLLSMILIIGCGRSADRGASRFRRRKAPARLRAPPWLLWACHGLRTTFLYPKGINLARVATPQQELLLLVHLLVVALHVIRMLLMIYHLII
jgi:hypothetical protein